MKKGILLLGLSVFMTSCITVNLYKKESNSDVEPKKHTLKKSALISSDIIAPLMKGDTEVFFLEGSTELGHFQHKIGDSIHGTQKNVFIFKSDDPNEAIQWGQVYLEGVDASKLGDSLALSKRNASLYSGDAVFISDDNKKVKIKIDSNKMKPIIIIDGEEMDLDFDMSSIDPDSIESINVLKGQKALQKVGEKGSNGVIMIQMKKQ